MTAALKFEAARARRALAADGFAILDSLFSFQELSVLRELMSQVQEPIEKELRAGRRPSFTKSQFVEGAENGAPTLDHLEILYPGSHNPALLETGVYRRCCELAATLAGPCSLSFDSLIVKPPQNRSSTLWHRDGDFSVLRALPAAFQSRLHMWVPLQGTCGANGTVKYVAGSHRERRRLNVPDDSVVICTVAEGGLTIHGSRTLHASDPNRSHGARKAWLLTFSRLGSAKRQFYRLLGRMPSPAAGRN